MCQMLLDAAFYCMMGIHTEICATADFNNTQKYTEASAGGCAVAHISLEAVFSVYEVR